MSETRKLLEKALEYLPSDASVYHKIRDFLAQPEEAGAAREAVLVEAINTLLNDIEKDGCSHWSKYGGAGQRQQGIRVFLANTSSRLLRRCWPKGRR